MAHLAHAQGGPATVTARTWHPLGQPTDEASDVLGFWSGAAAPHAQESASQGSDAARPAWFDGLTREVAFGWQRAPAQRPALGGVWGHTVALLVWGQAGPATRAAMVGEGCRVGQAATSALTLLHRASDGGAVVGLDLRCRAPQHSSEAVIAPLVARGDAPVGTQAAATERAAAWRLVAWVDAGGAVTRLAGVRIDGAWGPWPLRTWQPAAIPMRDRRLAQRRPPPWHALPAGWVALVEQGQGPADGQGADDDPIAGPRREALPMLHPGAPDTPPAPPRRHVVVADASGAPSALLAAGAVPPLPAEAAARDERGAGEAPIARCSAGPRPIAPGPALAVYADDGGPGAWITVALGAADESGAIVASGVAVWRADAEADDRARAVRVAAPLPCAGGEGRWQCLPGPAGLTCGFEVLALPSSLAFQPRAIPAPAVRSAPAPAPSASPSDTP